MIREVSCLELSNFDFLESENSFVKYLGYIIDDEVVGYIEYNDIYDSVDIVNVYVLEGYRRRGIARKLMNELISLSLKLEKKNITLEVSVLNESAISLYESLGFKNVAIRRGYYKGIDGILMELIL